MAKRKALQNTMGWLADRYPELAPPVLRRDKRTGKEWLGKELSEEELLTQELRKAAQADISAGNYSPFFPVEDRYYADPGLYDLQGNTLVDTLPKKQETIDRKIAQFDTPEARGSLREAYNAAKDDPLSGDWYAMGQLQDAYMSELGPKEGARAYKENFADAMAATTGGADPTANLLMAHYGNYLRRQGESPPGAAYGMPHPIGGRYVTGNMAMYDKVLNQDNPLTTAGQPKRFNFSANFLGDTSRATIDEQMTRGMTGGALNAPPQGSYGVLENIVAEEAANMGLPGAANLQDVAWAGYKGTQGKPMIQHVNEAVERTSRVTGLAPDEVVARMIRGEIPLYGLGGAAVGAGYLSEDGPDYPARM